jgi:hypothetical protein
MKATVYVCDFVIGINLYRANIPSIDWARTGFWCNEDWDFANGDDAKYWIPPSAIRVVTKEAA